MKCAKAAVLLFGLFYGVHSAASVDPSPDAAQRQLNEALRTKAQALAASGEPLALLAASRLMLLLELPAASPQPDAPTQTRGDAWLEQAIQRGSDQPQVARAAVARCLGTGACDIPVAVDTLRNGQAKDAAAQLMLWHMARAAGNAGEVDQAWARATHATRFSDGYSEDVTLLERMTRDLPLQDDARREGGDSLRLTLVYALASAAPAPNMHDLSRHCTADLADAALKQECERLMRVMAGSTSLLASSIGISRLQAYAADATEREHWRARRRELAWLVQQSTKRLGEWSGDRPTQDMQAYLTWTEQSGELGAMRRLLAESHVPAQPPEDWQPTLQK